METFVTEEPARIRGASGTRVDRAGHGLRPSRDGRGETALLAAGAALLYAGTWSGEYFHDSVVLIERLERGELGWVHPLYLPTGRALQLALAPLGVGDAEVVLAVLAVLTGCAVVAAAHRLALAWSGRRGPARAAACCTALAPAVWYGAGHVELHLFSGLGALVAALWALTGRGPLALRLAGGTLLAAGTHLTGILGAPFLLALGLEGERRRGRIGPGGSGRWGSVVLGALAIALAFVALRAGVAHLPQGGTAAAGFVRGVVELSIRRMGAPGAHLARLGSDVVLPWLGLLAGALLAPLAAPRERRAALGVGLATAAAVLWIWSLTAGQQHGQFALVILPVLVCSLAEVLSWAGARGRALRAAAAAAGLAHVAAAVLVHQRLVEDPDREWARAVAARVEPAATVFCFGQFRERRLRRLTEARVENFAPVGDGIRGDARPFVLDCALNHLEGQRPLYFDALVLRDGPRYPTLVPVVAALRECVGLRKVEGLGLLEVTGLRPSREALAGDLPLAPPGPGE